MDRQQVNVLPFLTETGVKRTYDPLADPLILLLATGSIFSPSQVMNYEMLKKKNRESVCILHFSFATIKMNPEGELIATIKKEESSKTTQREETYFRLYGFEAKWIGHYNGNAFQRLSLTYRSYCCSAMVASRYGSGASGWPSEKVALS